MEGPFAWAGSHDAALLEKVVGDAPSSRGGAAGHVELEFEVLAKPRGVVIPHRHGIPERLQHRVRVEDDVLHFVHSGVVAPRPTDGGDVRHDLLRGLRLTCGLRRHVSV